MSDMDIKVWTPGEVRELVDFAKRENRQTQEDVARLVGCSLAALRFWMTGTKEPSSMARRALSWAELHIKTGQSAYDHAAKNGARLR